jgi:DivIVA domain-containing protein
VIWVWVVVAVVVIGAVAVLIAGRDDEMAEVYDDRPDVPFPTGRPLTAEDLDELRFSTGVRGYRMDEVDAFIARVKADLIGRESAGESATPAADPVTEPGHGHVTEPGRDPVTEPASGAHRPSPVPLDSADESEETPVTEAPTDAESPHDSDADSAGAGDGKQRA